MKRPNRFIEILDKPSDREAARTAYLRPVKDKDSELPVYELSYPAGDQDQEVECEHYDQEHPVQLGWAQGFSDKFIGHYAHGEDGPRYDEAQSFGYAESYGCSGGDEAEEPDQTIHGRSMELNDHRCGCGCEESDASPTENYTSSNGRYSSEKSTREQINDWTDAMSVEDEQAEGGGDSIHETASNPAPEAAFPPPSTPGNSETPNSGSKDWEVPDTTQDDEKFRKDLEHILAGGKPPVSSPPAGPAKPAVGKGHDIFDKIAQNMKLATAYDLGAISLEQKFDSFEKDMEDEEEPPQSSIRAGASPVNPGSPAAGAVNRLITGTTQPNSGEFLQDLDQIKAHKAGSSRPAATPQNGEAPLDAIDHYEAQLEDELTNDKYPNHE